MEVALDSMVWMAQEFEDRVRKILEKEEDMRFRWDLYFPWYFLGDMVIVAVVAGLLVWWFR